MLAPLGPDGLTAEPSIDRKPLSSRTPTHTLVMSHRRENSCMLLVHDSITVSELINIPRRVFNEHTLVTMYRQLSLFSLNIKTQKCFTVHLF